MLLHGSTSLKKKQKQKQDKKQKTKKKGKENIYLTHSPPLFSLYIYIYIERQTD